MVCPKDVVALLFLACLLATSNAADSGLAGFGLVPSEGRRSLLKDGYGGGDPFGNERCEVPDTCTCFSKEWYCVKAGTLDVVFGPATQGGQPRQCKGENQWARKPLSGEECNCVNTDTKKNCVRTPAVPQDQGLNENNIINSALTFTSNNCEERGAIQKDCGGTGGGNGDPIITGFDERKFHFNDVGNFTLLSDAEGYLLEATFVGVGPVEAEVVPKETSWTSQVRIYNPKGDKIICHLPHILPNTSKIEVSAQAAGSSKATPMTPFHHTSVQSGDMSATALLSEGPNPVVTGCHVVLPKMEVTVYQVSGWDQASQFESEKWAAPYTWLNFDVKLLKPLSLPVTGVLGATYPVSPQDQAALEANSETAKIIKANVATDPVGMRELEEGSSSSGKARRLFSADMFPLAATFKGVQLP